MILEPGEKIHLILRRRFENDPRRHFVGEVLAVEGTLARVEGYTFVLDVRRNQFTRKPDKRVRIVGLGDCGNIINILPRHVNLAKIVYRHSPDKQLVVTDGETFTMDINEFDISC